MIFQQNLLPPKLQRRGLVFKRKLVTMERRSVYDGLLWSVCDGLLWRAFWRGRGTILSLVYGSYEQVAIWDAMEGRFLAVEGYNE